MSVQLKNRGGASALVTAVLILLAPAPNALAQCGVGGDFTGQCINLEWQPADQTVIVGETAEIALYATSVNDIDQPIGGIDMILVWDDHTVLSLAGTDDNGPYSWLQSWFPNDSALDGLNNDCGVDLFCDPFTYMPFNDGTAFYQAISTPAAALATPEGLLVTTLQFTALQEGTVQVSMPASCEAIYGPDSGCFAQTRVAGPPEAGVTTASIAPPVTIEVLNCFPPTAVVEGSRYLAVTPEDAGGDVAIRLVGTDPEVACVSTYVQANGTLAPTPVYLPPGPSGWDTVHVRGEDLIGSMTYDVVADCDPSDPGSKFSDPVPVTMWRFGDTNVDSVVDFVDITMVVDGFRNVWGTPICCTTDVDCAVLGPLSFCNTAWIGCQTPEVTPGRCQSTFVNLDLKGGFNCLPDTVVDFVDITAAVDAFRNIPDPCLGVCP
ncbi:MAG: hypothetical protein PVI86_09455 [Phycisphaerae bacterium]|jgi:hypothetical protein